jgi:hypothetical protein
MEVAKAELQAGFVETDATRAWDSPHEPEMQVAG